MIGFGKKQESAVLVLRDVQEITELLRQELGTATDDRRPGLERALALVEEVAAVPDAELRARWVRQRLAASGYEGPLDSVSAVKALRRAEPGLSLLQAVTYAREAAAVSPGAEAAPGR
ncbi:hypothetical protein [Streptomyces sp. NRRL WC-3549]|uniref:hypothetical protein n=1 Tax=Streptomyces sp. NRRL WC-3549 TaxID=1463925 RepID=UPI0004C5913B|nr:hypothetical protein [Streptomyces sp. NRRL WC-3549]